jgi:hypothetical protein
MKIIRRVIYGLLIAGTVVPPVRVLTVNSIDASYLALLMQISVISLIGLALWSAVWLRTEPMLARAALIFLALMVFATFWVHKL